MRMAITITSPAQMMPMISSTLPDLFCLISPAVNGCMSAATFVLPRAPKTCSVGSPPAASDAIISLISFSRRVRIIRASKPAKSPRKSIFMMVRWVR